jgi:hypothetical protein
MFTLEYAKYPVCISEDGQQILLTVKWEEFNEEMPFNACSFDTEVHGVDLYNRAKVGEFGEVSPYVAPLIKKQSTTTTTGTQPA